MENRRCGIKPISVQYITSALNKVNKDEGNTTLYLHANIRIHAEHSPTHLRTYTEQSPVAKAKNLQLGESCAFGSLLR